jgi:hypothetical protein
VPRENPAKNRAAIALEADAPLASDGEAKVGPGAYAGYDLQ